jgi:hypothetical protein
VPIIKHWHFHQTAEAISARQPSQQKQSSQPRTVPAVIRKQNTESLASGESKMIIVYYDGTVQKTLEDFADFLNASWRKMDKGKMAAKMAAKMAEMRRAEELVNTAEDNDAGNIMAADSDSGDADIPSPELEYVSTTQIKPLRDLAQQADAFGYKMARKDTTPGFFDEIKKELEWCHDQCEDAAHQFLRDGEFSTHVHKIKKKLEEVKNSAEQEMERIRQVEAANPTDASSNGRSRVLKAPRAVDEDGTRVGAMKNLG